MKLKNAIIGLSLLATAALTSCGGGGGTTTYGYYNTPYITANQFVNSLNSVDGTSFPNDSYIVRDIYSTDRSYYSSEDWFVIWDADRGTHMAVSLQYLRSLTYYSYYSSSYQTAAEYRFIEEADFYGANPYGVGSDYEEVYYDAFFDDYVGRVTGLSYEDEVESTDVNLLAGESQFKKLAQKVANISYAYEVSPEMALSLASLGDKVEGMIKKGASQEELTSADQEVLLNDLQHLTGVSLEEVIAASASADGKKAIIEKIAAKNAGSGITAQKLEDKILPELFGIK
ncbi:MAG: hypothetical protein K9K67_10235 [Bacteriovoracaceae bacterium]|nr:hypothetical protein [Bacteriovoracaceae bacterium]